MYMNFEAKGGFLATGKQPAYAPVISINNYRVNPIIYCIHSSTLYANN